MNNKIIDIKINYRTINNQTITRNTQGEPQ